MKKCIEKTCKKQWYKENWFCKQHANEFDEITKDFLTKTTKTDLLKIFRIKEE
jgi:hypothetical protein